MKGRGTEQEWGQDRCIQVSFWWGGEGDLRERDHLENLGVDGRILN
jgi:hypothetical protein